MHKWQMHKWQIHKCTNNKLQTTNGKWSMHKWQMLKFQMHKQSMHKFTKAKCPFSLQWGCPQNLRSKLIHVVSSVDADKVAESAVRQLEDVEDANAVASLM